MISLLLCALDAPGSNALLLFLQLMNVCAVFSRELAFLQRSVLLVALCLPRTVESPWSRVRLICGHHRCL